MKKRLVMAIGNPLLMDDRAGIEVVEQLEADDAFNYHTEVVYTVGFEVSDKLQGYDEVVIVDACLLNNEPGTILEVKLDDIFETNTLANSHAATLGTTLKTGYMLFPEDMPETLDIFLIEAENVTDFSPQCTPKVQAAALEVAGRIKERWSCAGNS